MSRGDNSRRIFSTYKESIFAWESPLEEKAGELNLERFICKGDNNESFCKVEIKNILVPNNLL